MSGKCARPLEILGTKCPCLRSAGGFVVIMCLFACFHQMVTSGIIPSILSSLETRYGFTSVQSGTILSIYDFVKLFLVIPVSYVGGKGHIPRNMAVCCLILGFGCLLFAAGELFGGRYVPAGGVQGGVCTSTAVTKCSGNGGTSGFYYLFLIGQAIMALGGSAPYCIGPAYIIGNSEPKKALAFIGAFYAASALGPAIGFLGGGALLGSWVDPSGLPAGFEYLTASDAAWVGNWWVGIMFCGFALIALTPFFLVMPNRMPTAPPEEHVEETAYGAKEGLAMIKLIATTPQWWLVTLAVTSETFAVSGYTGFGPKYVQTQFGMQAGTAGILTGGGIVPAAVIGMFFGGWWDGRKHTKLSQTAWFNTKCAAISTLFVIISAFVGCDSANIHGVDVATTQMNLVQGCNSPACACTEAFLPVCGADQITYFNPCFAGCANYTSATGDYSNCLCVNSNQSFATTNLAAATATSGVCDLNCGGMLGAFMFFFFVFLLFTFMNHTPSTAILMRVVPPSHKSLSLGMNDFTFKLLGTIPGPLSFGAVFDSSCVINTVACPGDTGSCALYNNLRVRLILFLAVGGVFKGLSTMFNMWSQRSLKQWEVSSEATAKLDPNSVEAEEEHRRDSALSPGLVLEAMGESSRQIALHAQEEAALSEERRKSAGGGEERKDPVERRKSTEGNRKLSAEKQQQQQQQQQQTSESGGGSATEPTASAIDVSGSMSPQSDPASV